MSIAILEAVEVNASVTAKDHVAIKEEGEVLMSALGYVGAAIALFSIGFFGFFLNLFVIILMCKEKQLWTPLNVILLNLVCSDFSVSILGNPFTLASSIAHEWIFGQVMCVVYGFFMSLLGITSITTLTVLAFERYVMVSKPFNSHHLTRRSAGYIVIGIWVYSAVLTIPPLFGWGDYVSEAANISCSVNWQEQTFNTTTYILFLFFFGLVVPVCVISFSYVNIIRTMKQNTMRMGRVNKLEGRVTYMVAVMIATFLIAWTPYAVLALLIQFGHPDYVSPAMAVIPALFAKSSICYNPLIYVGLNTQFRSSWRRFCGLPNPESSLVENENTMAGTRAFSQVITQDSVDDKKKCQVILLTETPAMKKICQMKPPASMKVSQSDGFLSHSQKLSVTSMNNRDKFTTKLMKD